MKKTLILFLLFFTLPVGAIIVDDSNLVGMCGAYKYDKVYAIFEANSYTCGANYYLPKQSTICVECPSAGFTCDGGTYTYSETIDQGLTPHTYTCDSGYFLPANSTTCAPCPSGWTCPGGTYEISRTEYRGLIKNNTYMAGDENGVCASNYGHKIYAVFAAIPYTCDAGYFLPAASTTCATCPAGYSCSGGTYYYNRINAQGLTRTDEYYTANENNACAMNFAHNLIAVFAKGDDCDVGEYLPANSDQCTMCPVNNSCSGGKYLFNETTDQGIVACSSGTFSPTGSAVCYPHILHVGDSNVYLKSTKQTTPSLNIKIGNDVFYANMTTERTKMNKDSSHYLHVKTADNVHYYVCDDTTCPSE